MISLAEDIQFGGFLHTTGRPCYGLAVSLLFLLVITFEKLYCCDEGSEKSLKKFASISLIIFYKSVCPSGIHFL
jgi:hypothetical protein